MAAESNVQSLQYVSDALKDDKAFFQALLAKEFTEPRVMKEILAHMSLRLKNNKEIVLGEIEERIATVSRSTKRMRVRVPSEIEEVEG